jgi:hypothetical protein
MTRPEEALADERVCKITEYKGQVRDRKEKKG